MTTPASAIDKATKFGERFGFPALIAIMLIGGLMYAMYFVMRYEVFYSSGKVEAMESKVTQMHDQHTTILSKQEASLELQTKQLCIQCGQCWNDANTNAEIKRCNCQPCE